MRASTSLRLGYVFRYDEITKYAHMVTLETVPLPPTPGGGGGGGGDSIGKEKGGDAAATFGGDALLFSDNEDVAAAAGGGGGGGDDGVLMFAAWQAAPLAAMESGEIKMAVEGLPEQRIWYSVSPDGGKSWSEPAKAPIPAPGALWSPVLHYDAERAVLWLMYSESRMCRHPNPPNNWAPGGDIKAVTLSHIALSGTAGTETGTAGTAGMGTGTEGGGGKSGGGGKNGGGGVGVGGGGDKGRRFGGVVTGRWSKPQTLLAQSQWGIPSVIANKLTVTSTGEWVLPYWQG